MKSLRSHGVWTAAVVAGGMLATATSASAAESTIRYNRDVRPILADNCFACHGPDANHRKAGLRLDTKEGFFEKTPKHEPTVVPGNLAKSELWLRITTTNLDDKMPPEDSHKSLKPEQIETLRKWILAGAPWEGHWAFIKPERPPVPTVKGLKAGGNPIDAFVFAKLQEKGLKPNKETDKRTLARRVYLDITGLPPKPEEVKAFLNDKSPDAYEKLVKRLLASPRYGEHRARYWLDAARYADTHGLHFDNYREMWPYRDWVIKAFNSNQRFNQFTIDQIAGDLLPNPTDDQETATGFQRCTMTTNEGGTIEDENLANYANDRVSTVGWVYLGMTMNCAACHDHKFDPITQKDFYSMAAFFRNTRQTGFDKNWSESDLYRVMPQTEMERARWRNLPSEIEVARKARDTQAREAAAAFTNWLVEAKAETLPKDLNLPGEYLRVPLNDFAGGNATGKLDGKPTQFTARGEFNKLQTNGLFGTAPVITKSNSFLLGDVADFERGEPFSIGAWVFLPKGFKGEGSVVAKMAPEEEKYRGWDFFVKDDEFGMYFVNRWSPVAMKVSSAGKSVKQGVWQHLFVTYDGTGRAPGVRLYVNGVEARADRDANRLEGSIRTPHPARIGRRQKGAELNNVAVQDVRIYRQRVSSTEVRALATAPRVAELLELVNAVVTNVVATNVATTNVATTNVALAKTASRDALRDYFLVTQHAGWQQAHAKLSGLEHEQHTIRGRSPVTLVQVEKTNSMPMAQVLFRGEYDKPKDKVTGAVPGFLHRMQEGAPTNRLGLAQWLVSPENPLTVRVTVNRFWQEVFGTGLVKTAEDFGITGDGPVNQALLDWLAVEFQESGWDVKRLIELMVTSATYRQSAETTPEKLEKDPANRLLSRGPRFRLDAEALRDAALASSGLLVEKIGGPSVKPYQPEGIWEAVAMPESNTRFYTRDSGEALYRRSLYTFWKRAAPPATMDIFNAPSREVCSVRRERTNTPLQALATLNDPQFVEAAKHLAQVALANGRKEEDALQAMAESVLSRPLTSKELSIVKGTLKEAQSFYSKDTEAAKQLLAVGESKASDKIPAPQLAAMTMVANQLMNLDEALNK
jgi:mono/diheme cytochrome c family protein